MAAEDCFFTPCFLLQAIEGGVYLLGNFSPDNACATGYFIKRYCSPQTFVTICSFTISTAECTRRI